MKRTILLAAATVMAVHVGAIEIENTAGQLSENLTDLSVRTLTVTGTVDARDFKFVGDKLTQLEALDLSQAQILAYSDPQCTLMNGIYNYDELTLPQTMLMNSPISSIVLPANLKAIGKAALAGCRNLTGITLPNNLETIGDFAFNGTSLTAITIPESVTIIGTGAFSHCNALQSATIPGASIGDYAFISDNALSNVTLGNAVTTIGNGAFSGCTALTMLNISTNSAITTIGNEAFASSGLEYIDLHSMSQLTTIGAWAFSNTPIQEINVPSTVTTMGEGSFYYSNLGLASIPVLNKIEDFTFAGNSSLISPRIIGEGTEIIGDYSFYGNTAADTLVLPSTVRYIGTRAMAGMTGLEEIIVLGDVALLGDSVWAGVDQPNVKLNTLRDAEISDAFAQAEQWKDFHVMYEYLLGDVNNDTRINVLDITTTIEYILNNHPVVFLFPAADVVVDNKINVLDVTGIVGLIMDREYIIVRAIQGRDLAESMMTTRDELTIEGLSLQPGETTTIAICLNNRQNYSALQFDMKLGKGLELENLNVATTERMSHHNVAIDQDTDGTYRIVAFSTDNADITGYDGAVLLLDVKATSELTVTSGIELNEVIFADRDMDYLSAPSFTPISTITGVNEISTTLASVHGDRGMLIIESNETTTAQIVNTSGMAMTVNVAQGSNEYTLDPGIYMVRIGAKTYKVVVK